MTGRIPTFFSGFLIVLIILIGSCRRQTEQQAYQRAIDLKDQRQQVTALKKFISDFPESKNRNRAYLAIFRDQVALGDTAAAVRAAVDYLALIPENARIQDYNRLAWSLAEKGMALDSARVFAERAVKLCRETNYPRISQVLDTYAFTLYKSGDAVSAEKIEQEALIGNEDDGEYLSSLARYQYANNKKEIAFENIARAILNGAAPDVLTMFDEWLDLEKSAGVSDRIDSDKIIAKTIDGFLKENKTPLARSQAALLLAASGNNLATAEKWARDAITAQAGKGSPDDQIMLVNNLASVYRANKDYTKVLEILEPWQDIALPYDQTYWLNLAQAYQQTDQRENAFHAVLNGLLLGDDENLLKIARNLGYSDSDVRNGIDRYKNELFTFKPGHEEYVESETNQVILAELFTGAECPPCVGADMALDLLAEYYPRGIVAILEYHLHIPGADPLTNPAGEARYLYYGKNFGTPTVFFNGMTQYIGGGPELVKKNLFTRYKQAVEQYFNPAPAYSLTLDCTVTNNRGQVTVEVAKTDTKETDKITLYLALVEKSVNYIGGNGMSHHAFVVRYLIGGDEGIPLKLKNGKAGQEQEIDFQKVNGRLHDYLDKFAENPPARYKNFPGWNVRPDTIDSRNLAVIAWIQNDETKEVYQAIYRDLK